MAGIFFRDPMRGPGLKFLLEIHVYEAVRTIFQPSLIIKLPPKAIPARFWS